MGWTMVDPLNHAEWPKELIGSLRPAKGTSAWQLQDALTDVELALAGGQTGELLLSPLQRPLQASVLALRARGAEAFPVAAMLPAATRRLVQRIERPLPIPPQPSGQPVSAL